MKKKLLPLFFFIGMIGSISAQNLTWMEGSWTGKGYQPNLGKDPYWDMDLVISLESGEGILKIEYPSIPCSANWEIISKELKRAVFVERLTKGKDRCIDGSKLTVTYVDQDHIQVVFYNPENDKEIYATAKLKRK